MPAALHICHSFSSLLLSFSLLIIVYIITYLSVVEDCILKVCKFQLTIPSLLYVCIKWTSKAAVAQAENVVLKGFLILDNYFLH